jgi:hypothetical protein
MKQREIVASDLQRCGYTQCLEAANCNGMTGCLKGDHQYVALRRQEVVRWAISFSTEKKLITKEKEEKMGQINTMKSNSKRRKAFGHLECTHYKDCTDLRITINELRKYKMAAIQETRWNKFTLQAFTTNGYYIYSSSLANNHEF